MHRLEGQVPRPPSAGDGLDTAAPVRPGEELNLDRLAAYLAEHLPGATADLSAAPLSAEQFPSGFSNLTYLLRLGDRRLVLRRPPFGARIATAHDMAREHRILSALAPVYPKAPRALLFCGDLEVLGAPFYLMERVEGVILRSSVARGPAPAAERLAAAAGALVETLAELHAVDWRAAGLGDLGRPERYAGRQVEGWTGRYRKAAPALDGGGIEEMDRVAAWLAARVPAGSGAALIHNDLKHDNLVLAPGDWGGSSRCSTGRWRRSAIRCSTSAPRSATGSIPAIRPRWSRSASARPRSRATPTAPASSSATPAPRGATSATPSSSMPTGSSSWR